MSAEAQAPTEAMLAEAERAGIDTAAIREDAARATPLKGRQMSTTPKAKPAYVPISPRLQKMLREVKPEDMATAARVTANLLARRAMNAKALKK